MSWLSGRGQPSVTSPRRSSQFCCRSSSPSRFQHGIFVQLCLLLFGVINQSRRYIWLVIYTKKNYIELYVGDLFNEGHYQHYICHKWKTSNLNGSNPFTVLWADWPPERITNPNNVSEWWILCSLHRDGKKKKGKIFMHNDSSSLAKHQKNHLKKSFLRLFGIVFVQLQTL